MAKPKLRDPSFPFYAGDWLSGQSVNTLTLAEQGAFVRLLCHSWLSGSCSLPDDPAILGALSGLGEAYFQTEPGKARSPLHRCFKLRAGKLHNEKLSALWQERQDHRRKSQEGGLKSGESRRSGTKGTSRLVRSKSEPNGNPSSASSSAQVSPNGDTPPTPLGDQVLAAWNSAPGVHKAERLNAKRTAALRTRLSDDGWRWREALAKFPLACFASDPEGWQPDFDWFLRPGTVDAILEGKYDWSKVNPGAKPRARNPGQEYMGE